MAHPFAKKKLKQTNPSRDTKERDGSKNKKKDNKTWNLQLLTNKSQPRENKADPRQGGKRGGDRKKNEIKKPSQPYRGVRSLAEAPLKDCDKKKYQRAQLATDRNRKGQKGQWKKKPLNGGKVLKHINNFRHEKMHAQRHAGSIVLIPRRGGRVFFNTLQRKALEKKRGKKGGKTQKKELALTKKYTTSNEKVDTKK